MSDREEKRKIRKKRNETKEKQKKFVTATAKQ